MKLWPPYSEIMEFLISSYPIVQLTSVKFCTLIKDENRDILIMSTPLGGGHIIFAFSGIRRPSCLVSGHFKEKYLSYVYQIWYGCLLG